MKNLIDRDRIKNWLIINIGTRVLNLWFSTCRVNIIGRHYFDRHVLGPEGAIGASWHRDAIFMVWSFRHFHPMIMFSRSKDGALIAGFAEKLGVIPIRGSSSSGGAEALRGMKKFLTEPGARFRKVASVLDGPRGPRCVAKRGMIALAKETGKPMIPIVVSAHPALTLKKTWDKSLIPLPFSRVIIMLGQPWHVPADINSEDIETMRQEFEDTLNEMKRRADRMTGYQE